MNPIENEKIYLKSLGRVAAPGTISKLNSYRFLAVKRDQTGRRFFLAFDLCRARELLDDARAFYKFRRDLLGKLGPGRIDDARARALWGARGSEAAMAALETGWGWRGVPVGPGGAE